MLDSITLITISGLIAGYLISIFWNRPSPPAILFETYERQRKQKEKEEKRKQRLMIVNHSRRWYRKRRGVYGRSLRCSYTAK